MKHIFYGQTRQMLLIAQHQNGCAVNDKLLSGRVSESFLGNEVSNGKHGILKTTLFPHSIMEAMLYAFTRQWSVEIWSGTGTTEPQTDCCLPNPLTRCLPRLVVRRQVMLAKKTWCWAGFGLRITELGLESCGAIACHGCPSWMSALRLGQPASAVRWSHAKGLDIIFGVVQANLRTRNI